MRVDRPTARLLGNLVYERAPSKIMCARGKGGGTRALGLRCGKEAHSRGRHLRGDSLAMMLLRANVRAGQRVLVVDSTQGLLTGAVLERLGGPSAAMTAAIMGVHPR